MPKPELTLSSAEQVAHIKFETALASLVFQYAVEVEQQNEALRREKEEIQREADIDPLTGLLTRAGFIKAFSDPRVSQARVQRGQNPQNSFLMIDIDNFKRANDDHPKGHAGGDAVLRGVAERLRATARKDDIIGRWGGDELAMFLPETHEAGALRLAKKIVKAVGSSPIDGMNITLSVGASEVPFAEPEMGQQYADLAAYAAKTAGKNQAVAYSSLIS